MKVLPKSSVLAATIVLLSACSESPDEALANRWGMFDAYCTDCHNDAEETGGLSLEGMTPDELAAHPELGEALVRKLRGKLMPPPGGPRPAAEQVKAFVAALEGTLDGAAAAQGPFPGRVTAHRMNRFEFETAVEELLAIDIDATRLLPPDTTSDGFDNVADVLRVSPTYLDQYIAAAREVSTKAVGNPAPEPSRTQYVAPNRNRTAHVHGLPLGTRDGLLVDHYFPSDGDYVFNLNVSSEPGAELRAYPQGWLEYRHTVILTVDGERVFEEELGGEEDMRAVDSRQISAVEEIKKRFQEIRVPVKAGYHEVAATFLARSYAESDFLLQSFVPGEAVPDVPWMIGMTIVGPYEPSGISETTRSRERIFSCYPNSTEEELPCAEQILTNLAHRAFRRPVNERDLGELLEFYRTGREAGGFEEGIQKGLLAIISSMHFLYRTEYERPQNVEPGESYAISDLELASRLAFFLWSRGPDEELLRIAESNSLSEPKVYEAQIDRMLADPRSKTLVTNFAFQWLGVRNLDTALPDERLYPYFDVDLKDAFEREMELFLDSILRAKDRSVLELLTASHTFLNERLARHYQIPDVRGDRFRRVELADPQRWGLFGKGSILTTTSYPDRTSPVLRGAWVMEHLLGTPPEPPPPGVETNLTQTANVAPQSIRERLEQHRTSPSCSACHAVIDPIGQALENYNAIGEWRERERESGVPIDPSGELAGGVKVDSPADLREALLEEPEQFVQTVTQKLMTYALGRTVEYYDMPTVRRIVRESAEEDYAFASLVKGVAKSAAFRMRSVPQAEPGETLAEANTAAAIRD